MATVNGQAYSQATSAPTTKVTAAVIAGAVTGVITWVLKQYFGVELPIEVAQALTVLIGFVAAYFTKEKPQV